MDFIREIHEARMTRGDNNQRELTYTDVLERLYLSLCIIDLVYKYPLHRNDIIKYVKRTTQYSDYSNFKADSTDLHNLIYFAAGDQTAINKLKNPDAAWSIRSQISIPVLSLNRYLTAISYGRELSSSDKSFLLKMEQTFRIKNTEYSKIRRDIMNWDTLVGFDKRQASTRLILASRSKLRNSDLHPLLEKLAADKNLEMTSGIVQDNEPKASIPDKAQSNEVIMYKYLYGEKTLNFPLIKQFLDRVERGETIPAHLVKAYAPAIKMLDEIVKAGPQYTNMVKIAHKRAKNKP